MIEPDKESIERALMEELWEELEKYRGLPLPQRCASVCLSPELKEKLSSRVREVLTPVSPSTVRVVHSPAEGGPLRIKITIGLSIDFLPRLLDL
ncbi:hypothetical protein [Microcoleus phage My-WqHQDG]|nr:hypothetical protein [Microcoleus phage My-WqHQDG]